MTASRRSRRTPALSAPEERLRTLGLDASPAARRLRARIPRSVPEPEHGTEPGVAVPRAPYAVGDTATPYIPEAPPPRPGQTAHWTSPSPPGPLWNGTSPAPPAPIESTAESTAEDEWTLETAPTVRITPGPGRPRPEPQSPWKDLSPPPRTPWKEPARPGPGREGEPEHPNGQTGAFSPASSSVPWDDGSGEPISQEELPSAGRRRDDAPAHGSAGPADVPPGSGAGPGPDPPPKEEPGEHSGGRHRRRAHAAPDRSDVVRPPSGYTELAPEAPDSVLERVAERWGSHASLSRRAVVALLVLGLLAVAGTVLALRDRPGEVTVPELVNQAAPEGHDPSDQASAATGGEEAGPGDAGEGSHAQDGDVVVHVGGDVAEPGLYTMPAGSRVADAVEEAGGPLPEADLDLVNLARTLTDGERILVGVPQAEGGSGDGPAGGAGSGSLVNLNLAGQAELETLPGIGQKKAQQILTHREALGGSFSSVEDLLGVDGIADKSFKTLEPLVTVG